MSKPRPSIIIQGDLIRLDSSVTVIPLTTRVSEVGRIRTSVVLDSGGSPQQNFAMVDKISTVKAGNVGMTLTAATRVYLMEPCLDPSMEVQAAGRIHRLGQTKEVFVKKLCYKDSLDGAIVHLHKQLSAGAISIVDNQFPVEALRILQADR